MFLPQVPSLLGTGLATVALGLLTFEPARADAGAVLGTGLAIKMTYTRVGDAEGLPMTCPVELGQHDPFPGRCGVGRGTRVGCHQQDAHPPGLGPRPNDSRPGPVPRRIRHLPESHCAAE